MSDLILQLDLSEFEKLGEDLKKLEGNVKAETAKLAAMTHSHVLEEAQSKLHSRREKFIENLAFEQISEDTWVVTVKQDAVWIEDGLPAFDMTESLLKNNAKIAADGSKYKVIPFEHSKGKSQQTSAQSSLTDTIKQELKKLKIPYMKIERDDHGKPKTGMLHSLNIENKPIKVGEGRGQGHGPEGQPMQGSTGIPFLRGIRIYQRALFKEDGTPKIDKAGKQMAQKSIMTFRVVSEKHKNSEKWQYPGIEGTHFLDEAFEWAERTWSEKIVPELMKNFA